MYLVTQCCFKAGPIIARDKKINASGSRLLTSPGAPGVATVKTLLNYAITDGRYKFSPSGGLDIDADIH